MIGPWSFGATPIRTPAGHSRSLEDTDRWLAGVIDRVPITRVYDATPLDHLGLPVWGAVTPLARDLKVHAGKGPTPQAARVSAVMEAVERVSAEHVESARLLTASYYALRRDQPDAAVDPLAFDLPFETTYTPDAPISWVQGYDLQSARHVWVPLDVVVSPAVEGVCVGIETNGLASGNCYTEAVLHALYEIIERDADASDRFTRRYADDDARPSIGLIAPDSLPDTAGEWAEVLRTAGMRVTVREIPNDLDVPVFGATISDRTFPGREGRITRFTGLGCDLDPAQAVFRAISEAVQSHTVVVVGARDTFEGDGGHAALDAGGLVRMLTAPSSLQPFRGDAGPLPGDDLYDRLAELLDRLASAGLDMCIAVELTRPDLDVPVVRVLVPGASGPYGSTARRPPLRLLRALV